MRKFMVVLAVLAVLSLLVAGAALAQGPAGQPNTLRSPQFQDKDGDGVCDVCGNAAPGQMGRRGGLMMGGRWGGSTLPSTVAEALDMSVQDVWAEVREGKTLRQVIVDHKGDPAAIVEQYVAGRKATLDQLVKDGRITQEQADLMLQHMREQATAHLDSSEFGGGMGCGNGQRPGNGAFGGRGGRGGRGVMRSGASA